MSQIGFEAKRGDDFTLVGEVKLPSTGFTMRSHARDSTGQKTILTVTRGDELGDKPGYYPITIECPHATTASWPIGILECDIEVTETATGMIVHTEIFSINVKKVITYGA